MERKTARLARQVFTLEMLDETGADFFPQHQRLIQRFVQHRVGDVTGAEFGQFFQFW